MNDSHADNLSKQQVIERILQVLQDADGDWLEEVANRVLIPKIKHVGDNRFVMVFDER